MLIVFYAMSKLSVVFMLCGLLLESVSSSMRQMPVLLMMVLTVFALLEAADACIADRLGRSAVESK